MLSDHPLKLPGTQLSFLEELFPPLRPHSCIGQVLVGFHKSPLSPGEPPWPPKGSRTAAAEPLPIASAAWARLPHRIRVSPQLEAASEPFRALDPAVLLSFSRTPGTGSAWARFFQTSLPGQFSDTVNERSNLLPSFFCHYLQCTFLTGLC